MALSKKRKLEALPVRASQLESDEELARRLHEELNSGFPKIISTRRSVKAQDLHSSNLVCSWLAPRAPAPGPGTGTHPGCVLPELPLTAPAPPPLPPPLPLQFDSAAALEPPKRKHKTEHQPESAPCSPSDDRLARKKSSFCRELHSLLTDVSARASIAAADAAPASVRCGKPAGPTGRRCS
jgi:hypothetical protein